MFQLFSMKESRERTSSVLSTSISVCLFIEVIHPATRLWRRGLWKDSSLSWTLLIMVMMQGFWVLTDYPGFCRPGYDERILIPDLQFRILSTKIWYRGSDSWLTIPDSVDQEYDASILTSDYHQFCQCSFQCCLFFQLEGLRISVFVHVFSVKTTINRQLFP